MITSKDKLEKMRAELSPACLNQKISWERGFNALMPLLLEALEMASYYASKENYDLHKWNNPKGRCEFSVLIDDFNKTDEDERAHGGKRARAFLDKFEKVLGEK